MQFVFLFVTYCIVGITETSTGGLDQFWANDFKAFEQIYGKTNDKDIYGATLPSPVNYEGDLKRDSSDKKDRYYFNEEDDFSEPYDLGDSYKKLLLKNSLKKRKTPGFITYSDFKPISRDNDAETYNFLRHLDEADREQRRFSSKGGNRPYHDYGEDPEDTDAYRSIQEILDAHESKKSKDRDDRKYSAKRQKPSRAYNYGPSKSKCPTGRCRQRVNTVRVRTGPYVKSGKK